MQRIYRRAGRDVETPADAVHDKGASTVAAHLKARSSSQDLASQTRTVESEAALMIWLPSGE